MIKQKYFFPKSPVVTKSVDNGGAFSALLTDLSKSI